MAPKPKRKKSKKNRKSDLEKLTQGILNTGLGTGMGGMAEDQLVPCVAAMPQLDPGISSVLDPDVEGWLLNYLDPCGEHRTGLDWKKVPDGAMPQSAPFEWRFLDTITRPGQTLAEVDTTTRNFSMLILQTPLFRSGCLCLVHLLSSEFDDKVMDSFNRSFNTIDDSSRALYPNWVATDLVEMVGIEEKSVLYWCNLQSDAVDQIIRPTDTGASTLINQFRFTGYGVDVMHNTPTLFDQATCVMGCFNANMNKISINHSEFRGWEYRYLLTYIAPDPMVNGIYNVANRLAFANGDFVLDSSITWVGALVGPDYEGPTLVATERLRIPASSFVIDVGDEFRYDGVRGRMRIYNITTDISYTISPIPAGPISNTVRVYILEPVADDVEILPEDYLQSVTQLFLPPTTQASIQQQDVQATHYLMKDYGGVYLPNRIWEPVFFPQSAGNYGRVVIANQNTTVNDMDSPRGWFDSLDLNFGIGVMNFQSMPYAAAPFIKMIRSDEWVPGKGSLLGGFVTRSGHNDEIIRELALTISKRTKHGYPSTFNGLGLLMANVSTMLARLPRAFAHAGNIAHNVNNIVDQLGLFTDGSKSKRAF